MKLCADVVLRTRPETYSASFNELAAEIVQALNRLQEWHLTQIPNELNQKTHLK